MFSSNHQNQEDFDALTVDKDLFEDDISQATKEINNFSSPHVLIDTQNRIWIKIIEREKLNFDAKKKKAISNKVNSHYNNY